jgi:hypothetical protein
MFVKGMEKAFVPRQWRRGKRQGGQSSLCAGALAKAHARRGARGVRALPAKTDALHAEWGMGRVKNFKQEQTENTESEFQNSVLSVCSCSKSGMQSVQTLRDGCKHVR